MFKDLLKKFIPIIIHEAIDVVKELILKRRNKKVLKNSKNVHPHDA